MSRMNSSEDILSRKSKGPYIWAGRGRQDHGGSVARAVAHGVLCERDPSAGVTMGCVPQGPWRPLLCAEKFLNKFHLNNPNITSSYQWT
jgi:hypothetical protein